MLRQCLKWREEIDIENHQNRQTPEVLKLLPNISLPIGKAKNGSPIVYLNYTGADMKGLFRCIQTKDFMWWLCYELEMADAVVRSTSKPYKGLTLVCDYNRISMDVLSKQNLDFEKQFNPIMEKNFPEIVNKVLILNGSTVLHIFLKLVKYLIPKETLSKLEFLKDPKDLKKFIDDDQLIGHYGGTLVDEDGDPKFSSKIIYPTKIPESFYIAPNFADYELNSDYTKVEIGRGKEISVAVEVATIGFSIIWFVLSKDGELEIGINFKAESGDVEPVEPMSKVNCDVCPESGSKICSKVGTYTVVIRNNAVLKSKKVAYNVEVLKEDDSEPILTKL
ncbi:unnamed protein product [Owenia fusiformis]|nr:unnamed protein product [Owenia fusiformis]